jgi:hypothetical protein
MEGKEEQYHCMKARFFRLVTALAEHKLHPFFSQDIKSLMVKLFGVF